MTTLKEIAKRANVSFQAVSAALNNSGTSRISPERREQILKIAAEMNYRPNRMASGLRRRSSSLIGIVLSSCDMYDIEIISAIHARLQNTHYSAILTISGTSPERNSTDKLLEQQTDGIIFLRPEKNINTGGIPYICRDNTIEKNPEHDLVCVDFASAAACALRYLADLGHRKVGYIGPTHDARYRTFIRNLEACCLSTKDCWMYHDWGFHETGRQGAAQIAESRDLPTAVVCFNDTVALGAMAEFQARSIRVPEDISVIGFDDMPFSRYLHPALTTFNTFIRKTGELLTDQLIHRIADPAQPPHVDIITPSLVERGSCASPGAGRDFSARRKKQ